MKKYAGLIDNLIIVSLCILIIGLPFSNTIIEITASIAIILWAFKKLFISRSLKLEKTPLNRPILFYLLFVSLSMFNSQFLMTSLKGFFFKTMEHFLLFFVIVETVKTGRDIKNLVSAILLSCALIGIDGLWQYFKGHDFLRYYPLWSSGRITASFKFPNGLGGWLITVIPICISLAIFNTKEKLFKVPGIFLCALLFICLIFSFTIGAWIAIVPAIMFLGWRKGGFARKLPLLLLLIIISAVAIMGIFGDKEFISGCVVKGHSVFYRITLAELCWNMFVDHPFFGHGINTFMSIYENYSSSSVFTGIAYAHNCYFQMAVETGIFGLSAFLWMIAALFVSSLTDINRRKEGFIKTSQIGFLAGLLAYLVHSASESNLYALQLAILFYYMLGVTVSIQKVKEL